MTGPTASRPSLMPRSASRRTSFLIDGEAVIARDDGTPDFHALRSKRRGHEAVLYAFDLIEHDGDDLRDLPLIERKRRLAKLIGRAKRRAIRFVEHLAGDGPTVFDHVCRMGLEGIVSKRTDAPYRSGPSKVWLKSKNPASEAVRREREEEWYTSLARPSSMLLLCIFSFSSSGTTRTVGDGGSRWRPASVINCSGKIPANL